LTDIGVPNSDIVVALSTNGTPIPTILDREYSVRKVFEFGDQLWRSQLPTIYGPLFDYVLSLVHEVARVPLQAGGRRFDALY
jgi:hypothetical protein